MRTETVTKKKLYEFYILSAIFKQITSNDAGKHSIKSLVEYYACYFEAKYCKLYNVKHY